MACVWPQCIAAHTRSYNKLLPICKTLEHAHRWIVWIVYADVWNWSGLTHMRTPSTHKSTFISCICFSFSFTLAAAMIFTIPLGRCMYKIMIFTKCCALFRLFSVFVFFFPFVQSKMLIIIRTVTLKPQNQLHRCDHLFRLLTYCCVRRCVVPWIIFHFDCITSQEFQVFFFLFELYFISVWTFSFLFKRKIDSSLRIEIFYVISCTINKMKFLLNEKSITKELL